MSLHGVQASVELQCWTKSFDELNAQPIMELALLQLDVHTQMLETQGMVGTQ